MTLKSDRPVPSREARSEPAWSHARKYTSASVIGPALVLAMMLAALRLTDRISLGLNGTVITRSSSRGSAAPVVASASCACVGLGTKTFAA